MSVLRDPADPAPGGYDSDATEPASPFASSDEELGAAAEELACLDSEDSDDAEFVGIEGRGRLANVATVDGSSSSGWSGNARVAKRWRADDEHEGSAVAGNGGKNFKNVRGTGGANIVAKHPCPHCPYAGPSREQLKRHLRTHTGEKPYKCDVCGYRFALKKTLNNHVLTHAGKPFTCDTCGSRFSQKRYLQSHIRSHTGERPFKCETCGDRFTRKDHLQAHIRSHTGEKPFPCSHCPYRAAESGTLRKHERSRHGAATALPL